ncbi:hypothetical protein [Limibacillus sp. MBR-115]|jgi:hypothetical protein|uniref:hypothetical protein n=1 Tax=Limibacillus sp. MBR-115 TaxID=3156465 RepID=UPI0033924BE9
MRQHPQQIDIEDAVLVRQALDRRREELKLHYARLFAGVLTAAAKRKASEERTQRALTYLAERFRRATLDALGEAKAAVETLSIPMVGRA